MHIQRGSEFRKHLNSVCFGCRKGHMTLKTRHVRGFRLSISVDNFIDINKLFLYIKWYRLRKFKNRTTFNHSNLY